MLEKFRLALFRNALRRNLTNQERRRKTHTLESARTVGILFDASADKNRREVLDFAKNLEKSGKKVRLLGFFAEKKLPENLSFDCFGLKDLTFSLQPKSEKALAFAKEKFDLLLCLNPDKQAAVEWVAVQSQAAMKIGYATELPDDYDLQLEIPADKSLRFFVEQLELYLDKIVLTKNEPARAI